MPYRGIDSFEINEEVILKWVRDLKPSTARSYTYYFLKYTEWFTKRGYWSSVEEMLENAKNDVSKHLDILLEYLKSLSTGLKDKKNRYYAIRNFYEYYRITLPRLSRQEMNRVFCPSELDKLRAVSLKPLTIEEVKSIIIHAPQPYKAAYMVCFQGALSGAEYDQFNRYGYRQVLNRLDEKEPVRVDLIRSKVSRIEVRKYYTFLGRDSKTLIKEWINMRPDCDLEELFIVYNRKNKQYVPLTSRLLGNMLTKIAKRLGLIQQSNLGRYHIHLHEFRDLFRSLCTVYGVNSTVSEFLMGHVIDRLNYDKSPEYNEEWFREEYKKVEPVLNILSEGMAVEKVREVKEELQSIMLENRELKERLHKVEKALKIFMEIAMKDPEALPAFGQFLKK